MSQLYIGGAALLNSFLADKAPLTSLVYNSNEIPDKQKKAAYALILGTLRCKKAASRESDRGNHQN
jgi:hypothetical protein